MKVKFVLRELPKDQQEKIIDLNPLDTIGKIKGIVRKEYGVNQLYAITLTHNGEVLEDDKQVRNYDLAVEKVGKTGKSGKVIVLLIDSSKIRE